MIEIYEDPYKIIQLEYHTPEEVVTINQAELVKMALSAIFSLRFCEPLKVDVRLAYYEQEYGSRIPDSPPNTFWMLKQTDLNKDIIANPYWNDEKGQLINVITEEVTHRWVAQAMTSNPINDGNTIGLAELLIRTSRCYLPDDIVTEENDYLTVKERNDFYKAPIIHRNHQVWIEGPAHPYAQYPPIEITMSQEYGIINLKIYFYWSVYDFSNLTHVSLIQESIDLLLTKGWQQVED